MAQLFNAKGLEDTLLRSLNIEMKRMAEPLAEKLLEDSRKRVEEAFEENRAYAEKELDAIEQRLRDLMAARLVALVRSNLSMYENQGELHIVLHQAVPKK